MYRCVSCRTVSQPGQQQIKHVFYRPNGQIAQEVPVCHDCHLALTVGVPFSLLRRQSGVFTPVPCKPNERPTPVHTPDLPSRVRDREWELEQEEREAKTPIVVSNPRATPVLVGKPSTLLGRPVVAATPKPTPTPASTPTTKPKKVATADPNNLTLRCDLCGEPAGEGQVTAGTILCVKHAEEARERSRPKKRRKKS